ncbi:hypothetical protein LX32DRAFT_725249 [Colletotrichum zoysiae]|uniref:DUF7726 domain-containing protein n=1 Tax=Colletotrichum zoysiae TaxID=1216348 RepID=A0AAD9M8B6_9PEZI|nr:hypothetical protein LX32DRAFT_725249 [Colletotrichum zoysiae]
MAPATAAAVPAAPEPLSDADANRVRAPNSTKTKPAEKPPAPRPRKRKSDVAAAPTITPGPPAKKKQAAKRPNNPNGPDPLPDLSGVRLDDGDDEDMSVPVYDTCDTVRSKIRRALRRPGVTRAAFLRALVKAAYPPGSAHKIAPNLLDNFLAKKGPVAGNTSSVFYAAYVYFEKLRVRDGRPKTGRREEMELEWPGGFETRELLDRRSYVVAAGSELAMSSFGKPVVLHRGGGGVRRLLLMSNVIIMFFAACFG